MEEAIKIEWTFTRDLLLIVRGKMETKRENCAKTLFYQDNGVVRGNRDWDWINGRRNREISVDRSNSESSRERD